MSAKKSTAQAEFEIVDDATAAPGKTAKPAKKYQGQPKPQWREFMQAAWRQVAQVNGFDYRCAPGLTGEPIPAAAMSGELTVNAIAIDADVIGRVAAQIVAHGDGAAFLKAVRRGRSTQRQNLRYQLLREVEKLVGDTVPRRRPDANTPDSVALKKKVSLELQAYADAGSGTIGAAD